MISRVNICVDRNETLEILKESIKDYLGDRTDPTALIKSERFFLTLRMFVVAIADVIAITTCNAGVILFIIWQTFEIYRISKHITKLMVELKSYHQWKYDRDTTLSYFDMATEVDEKRYDTWYFLESPPNIPITIADNMTPCCKLLFLLQNCKIKSLVSTHNKLAVVTADQGTFYIDAIVKDDSANSVSVTRSGVFLSMLSETPRSASCIFNYNTQEGCYVKEALYD